MSQYQWIHVLLVVGALMVVVAWAHDEGCRGLRPVLFGLACAFVLVFVLVGLSGRAA